MLESTTRIKSYRVLFLTALNSNGLTIIVPESAAVFPSGFFTDRKYFAGRKFTVTVSTRRSALKSDTPSNVAHPVEVSG